MNGDWIDEHETVDNTVGEMMISLGYRMYEGFLRNRFEKERRKNPTCEYCNDYHSFEVTYYKLTTVKSSSESDDEVSKKRKAKGADQKEKKEIVAFSKRLSCKCEGAQKYAAKIERVSNYFGNDFKCSLCGKKMLINDYWQLRVEHGKLICYECEKSGKESHLDKNMIKLAGKMKPPRDVEVEKKLAEIFEKIDREFHPEKYPAIDPWAELKAKMKQRAEEMGLIENG
jgi:transcription elongation factor Elf1